VTVPQLLGGKRERIAAFKRDGVVFAI